jgi:hypothetical protein
MGLRSKPDQEIFGALRLRKSLIHKETHWPLATNNARESKPDQEIAQPRVL